MKHSIVSDSLTSVLAHGKLGQSSLQLSSVLQRAEVRIDRAQAETLAAERFAAAQHTAMQMLLAAEAALADAAEARAEYVYECRARWQAEAQRDVWQTLAVYQLNLKPPGL